MLTVQYASTINIGVFDGQYLILLLMLQHSGMANTKRNSDIRSAQRGQWCSGRCTVSTGLPCRSLHRPTNDRLCPTFYFRLYFCPQFKTFSLISYFLCQNFSPERFLELTYDGHRLSWMLSRIAAGTNNHEKPSTILNMNFNRLYRNVGTVYRNFCCPILKETVTPE